ncbi:uncharacterized protein [Euwallacea fornicatus]|uniref:uncharacterized protein n=1 Tax=Euwallacea fornicatus TaxID=995702 RepID=UPI00338DD67C
MCHLKLLNIYLVILWNLNSATSIYLPFNIHSANLKSKEYGVDYSEHPGILDFTYDNKYLVSNKKLTWFDAQQACSMLGLHLIYPRNYYDRINITFHISMNYLPSDTYSGYWIGGFKKTDGDFSWIDGSPVGKSGWLQGEPNSFSGENCIEFKRENYHSGMGFNNLYCNELRRYICRGLFREGEERETYKYTKGEVEKNASDSLVKMIFTLNNITHLKPKLTTIITSTAIMETNSTSEATTPIATTSTVMVTSTTDLTTTIPIESTIPTTTGSPPNSTLRARSPIYLYSRMG